MPRCEDYIERISAAIDGELSPQETARLEEHLAHCPACQALMGDLAALHAQLGALPPVEIPKNLKEDILAAVHDSKVTPLPTKKNFYYKKWMASAAALALVMAGAWGWSVSRPGSPSPLPLAGNMEAAAPQETPVSAKAADSAASGSISTPAPVVTAAPALDGVPAPASLPAPESADVSESAMDGAAQVPAQGRAKAPESPQAAEPAPQNDAVPQMAVQSRRAAPPAGAGPEEAGETVPTASPQLFCALPPADSGVGMEPDNSLEPQPTPEPVPNAFAAASAPVEDPSAPDAPAESSEGPELTAGKALALLLEQYPMPGCETWEFDDIEPGWQSPSWTEGKPEDAWYLSCVLQYDGFFYVGGNPATTYNFSEYETLLNPDSLSDEDLADWRPVWISYEITPDGEIIVVGN